MRELIPMITERDGIPVTTSRAVAEQFGKAHRNILRDIEKLIQDLEQTDEGKTFNRLNFELISAKDAMNREQPLYILTRDGFTLLAMGFTGAKAVQFKVAYINAFNRMERLISCGGHTNDGNTKSFSVYTDGCKEGMRTREGSVFLQALQEAVSSGHYLICYTSRLKEPFSGIILGKCHGDAIAIKSGIAYKIYAESVSEPLSISALWSVLELLGVIEARGTNEYPHATTFKRGYKANAIYIKRTKWDNFMFAESSIGRAL